MDDKTLKELHRRLDRIEELALKLAAGLQPLPNKPLPRRSQLDTVGLMAETIRQAAQGKAGQFTMDDVVTWIGMEHLTPAQRRATVGRALNRLGVPQLRTSKQRYYLFKL